VGFGLVAVAAFLVGLAISAWATRRRVWIAIAGVALALAFAGYAAASWEDSDLTAGEGFVWIFSFLAAPWAMGFLVGHVVGRAIR
jgi:hypothetical protein